jgi:parallel beta helix pectate lyase-like protein
MSGPLNVRDAPLGRRVPVPQVALSTGPVVEIPDSVRGDCSVDVSTALNQWLASVPDNSTARLGTRRCYLISAPVIVAGRTRLALDGNGATLQSTPPRVEVTREGRRAERGRVTLKIQSSHDIVVHDLTVRGSLVSPNPGQLPTYEKRFEAEHGIAVLSASNVRIAHVTVQNVRGDFVYIGARTDASDGVTVVDSTLENSGRQGISITDATNVLVQGNLIGSIGRSLFDLEPNSRRNVVRNIRLVANITGRARNFWLADKAPRAMNVGDVTISGNVMRERTGALLFVFGAGPGTRGPFTISGNTFLVANAVSDEGSKGAFLFAHSADVKITDNHAIFPAGTHMPAVELRACAHVTVLRNRFDDAGPIVVSDAQTHDVTQ